MSAFATVSGLARQIARKIQTAERCEMCGVPLGRQHPHLLDPQSRRLACACDACAHLFYSDGETKYKSVPRSVRFLEDFHLSDGQWEDLLIPIGLAFFVKSSVEQRVLALYPSPAGPTESLLTLDAWTDIAVENPIIATFVSDVEALLVNRLVQPAEYYLAPIDKCYELVGLIRANWHGLSGGAEMWTKVQQFFTHLRENAHA